MGAKGKKQYKWTNKEIDYLKSIEEISKLYKD